MESPKLTIAIKTLAGETYQVETYTFQCTADSIAFEHHFHVSVGVMQEFYDQETREPIEGADWSKFRQEWMVFFCWRAIRRGRPEVGDFAVFVEDLAEIDVLREKEEAPAERHERLDPPVPARIAG